MSKCIATYEEESMPPIDVWNFKGRTETNQYNMFLLYEPRHFYNRHLNFDEQDNILSVNMWSSVIVWRKSKNKNTLSVLRG